MGPLDLVLALGMGGVVAGTLLALQRTPTPSPTGAAETPQAPVQGDGDDVPTPHRDRLVALGVCTWLVLGYLGASLVGALAPFAGYPDDAGLAVLAAAAVGLAGLAAWVLVRVSALRQAAPQAPLIAVTAIALGLLLSGLTVPVVWVVGVPFFAGAVVALREWRRRPPTGLRLRGLDDPVLGVMGLLAVASVVLLLAAPPTDFPEARHRWSAEVEADHGVAWSLTMPFLTLAPSDPTGQGGEERALHQAALDALHGSLHVASGTGRATATADGHVVAHGTGPVTVEAQRTFRGSWQERMAYQSFVVTDNRFVLADDATGPVGVSVWADMHPGSAACFKAASLQAVLAPGEVFLVPLGAPDASQRLAPVPLRTHICP